MTDSLAKKTDAVEKKLRGTLTAGSLEDLVQQRKATRKSYLLLDTSGSMNDPVDNNWSVANPVRKIDAMQAILDGLGTDGVEIPKIAFSDDACIVQKLPPAGGGTALHTGIDFAKRIGAEHLIVISDGCPDNRKLALKAGKSFDGPIDVFYVGPAGGPGEQFLAELCNTTGGQYAPADLGRPKELKSSIKGLLGSGTPQLTGRKSPINL